DGSAFCAAADSAGAVILLQANCVSDTSDTNQVRTAIFRVRRVIDTSRYAAEYNNKAAPGQNMAMGFTGEPVPFGIGNGAIVSMNSHRFRAAAMSPSLSKSARSMR